MKRLSPSPIFIYLKISLEVLLGKMTDPNRQYSSQVFRFEEVIHVLFSLANFSLNFRFPVEASVFLYFYTTPLESVLEQIKTHPNRGNCCFEEALRVLCASSNI